MVWFGGDQVPKFYLDNPPPLPGHQKFGDLVRVPLGPKFPKSIGRRRPPRPKVTIGKLGVVFSPDFPPKKFWQQSWLKTPMSPIVSFGLGDLKPQIPKIWGRTPPSRAPKPSRPKETIGKIGELSSRTLGETRVKHIFFKVCWGELGGKIWAETLRPSSSPLAWVAWEPPPNGFRNFGPFAVFTLHAFTFFTTFAIFTVVLFLPFFGSTLLGACSRLSTYRRHPHLNSVECGGPSLVKTLMATIHFSPFMANGSVFKTLNLITQLLSQPQNPDQPAKPQTPSCFYEIAPPPHPALENKTPNFRSSP